MVLSGFESSWLLNEMKVPLCWLFIFNRSGRKKEHLNENDIGHSYGNYFKSAILKVTWYQQYSKFFLSICEAHWQRNLKDILLTVEDFKEMDQHDVPILSWINMKQKLVKVHWKLSVVQKSELVLWRTMHRDISLIIVFFFFSETNLLFRFNLQPLSQYFETFWYFNKFPFNHKWNDERSLLINMIYTSCLLLPKWKFCQC